MNDPSSVGGYPRKTPPFNVTSAFEGVRRGKKELAMEDGVFTVAIEPLVANDVALT